MVNVLKLIENSSKDYQDVGIIREEIKYELFKNIACKCGFNVLERYREGDHKKIVKLSNRKIPCVKLYTQYENAHFNFLDISDVHIGNPNFDFDKLHRVLKKAVKRNVDFVFIAGDLFDGICDDKVLDFRILNHEKIKMVEKEFKRQVGMAYNIFRKYDLNYHVINGNHEYSFEQLTMPSPIKTLESKLKGDGINFNAWDTYLIDFEIAGVIKRVIHLESFYERPQIMNSVERLYEFNSNGGLYVHDGNEKIPIRFLECGHIHTTLELYNSHYEVFINQPGSFIKGENVYDPGIFVKGEVTKDKHIIRY